MSAESVLQESFSAQAGKFEAAGTCICGRTLTSHAKEVICLDTVPKMLEVGKAAAVKEGIIFVS